MKTIGDIAEIFARRGAEQYSGEPVTQLEHALQCAWLAEQNGCDDELVTASLLHDLGHLLCDLNTDYGQSPTLKGFDDLHQYVAIPFLHGLFSESLLNTIKLHVDAKRFLCATRPEYFTSLSADSVRSLALQGGIFSPDQARKFIVQPGARAAVRLRIWDDLAKAPNLDTPSIEHFLQRARRCVLPSAKT